MMVGIPSRRYSGRVSLRILRGAAMMDATRRWSAWSTPLTPLATWRLTLSKSVNFGSLPKTSANRRMYSP
eukprot:5996718-Pyramimonas_sp.AAC.1